MLNLSIQEQKQINGGAYVVEVRRSGVYWYEVSFDTKEEAKKYIQRVSGNGITAFIK